MSTERRFLYDKADSYLFSFDVTAEMVQSGKGWNVLHNPKAPPSGHDVFHVKGETIVNNHDAVIGNVVSVVGRFDFRSYADAAGASGKMLIRTRDGVVIETMYYGAHRLPELGQRKLLTDDKLDPMEVKVSYWLRFDTSNAKYRWLAQTPCVGFGRAVIAPTKKRGGDGFPELTFDTQVDVYALT
jgi:Protein of unknown function (DUF3237)